MYLQRCLLLCSFFLWFALPCESRDIITSSLKYGETIVSAGKRFELGFFSPEAEGANFYVGIWYYQRKPQTVVWVANKDSPCSDSSGSIIAIKDANFTGLSGNGSSCFSIAIGQPSNSNNNWTAQLLDSGNLVFIDESGETLWQSFDNPSDTFLPGMKMVDGFTLTSWANSGYNPANGNYTFTQDQGDAKQYTICKRTVTPYWKNSGGMPPFVSSMLSNFSRTNRSRLPSYDNPRLLMNSSGEIQFYIWDTKKVGWFLQWSEPHDRCSVYNFCGKNGICSINNDDNGSPCNCLPGFKPTSPDDWRAKEYSGGCSRKSFISCNQNTERETFLNLTSMAFGNQSSSFPNAMSEEDCREECLGNCECQAYLYGVVDPNLRQKGTGNLTKECRIWTSDVIGLQQVNAHGLNLSIRIAISDIELTRRNCHLCGLRLVPYPLSSQPDCGDPMYYSFSCNESTGDLSFQASNESYPVTDISLENRSFVIQFPKNYSDSCNTRNRGNGVILLNLSPTFIVTNWCYNDKNTIQISWIPPLEPTCSASNDCEDWPNSICNATKQGQGRCLCKPGFNWDGSSLNCSSVLVTTGPGSSSKRTKSSVKFRLVIISISAILAVVILCSIGYIIYRRNSVHQRKDKRILGNIGDQENDLLTEDEKKAIDIPFFGLETILAATENFSDENKLGQGGFGPVYKGIFHGGQEIAVKRLLSHSGQGVNEFKNEIVLIAKLQHRNLVKLLGYCITTNEKILLYEYMPNKSLDAIIFDSTLSGILDWKMRFEIILGIGRGLLYLHQDSRLRIIHRDLKASNILLDEEMNPKISDFGLARIVEGKNIEANTKKVVGTLGYMPPEYALEGLFSIKSDVFSFGVVVLEIVSGRRNTSFFQSQESLNLLGHAWKFWMDEKALDMMDPILLSSCNESEVLRCINIGLLCVQEDPNERPTMSDVVIMLATENMSLSRPKQPAFVARRHVSEMASSSSSKISAQSNNELTASMVEGR